MTPPTTKPRSIAVISTLLATSLLATSVSTFTPTPITTTSAPSIFGTGRTRIVQQQQQQQQQQKQQQQHDTYPRRHLQIFSQSPSTTSDETETQEKNNNSSTNNNNNDAIATATQTLQNYDTSQQQFIKSDNSQGMGGGLSALHHIQSLTPSTRSSLQSAIHTLISQAHTERALDSSQGRIMLGFCASNAPEALGGLKSWVSTLELPRGMLHGMDVDGIPIPVEELGAVYVKYSTGGAMTFSEMRRSGRGFDSLWRPGDALLEMYDGDFRGVYLNVELGDGVFRQFGVLPTDLFMVEEDW